MPGGNKKPCILKKIVLVVALFEKYDLLLLPGIKDWVSLLKSLKIFLKLFPLRISSFFVQCRIYLVKIPLNFNFYKSEAESKQ